MTQSDSLPDSSEQAKSLHSVTFRVDASTRTLVASYDPQQGPAPDGQVFREWLDQAGFSKYALNNAAIAGFLTQIRTHAERYVMQIGSEVDAELQLDLSPDLMTASLTVIPAQGGKNVDGAQIQDLLRSRGITFGIIDEEIQRIINEQSCENLVIARGKPPGAGTPARLENLVDQKAQSLHSVDENAVVRFNEMGHLLLTQPGEALLRIHPPVQGEHGTDVRGQVVFAKPLENLQFDTECRGTRRDPQDPNVLVAAIAGQPKVSGTLAIVNPVIEVPEVNLETGNIKFDGSIHIEGDVKAGMRVEVSGDAFVSGALESCELIAGGDIEIRGGVIGHGDIHGSGRAISRLKAGGSVHALFIESAYVEAKHVVVVERFVRMSEIFAGEEVLVGQGDVRQSVIVGGVTQAGRLIQCAVVGAATTVKTILRAGHDPVLEQAYAEIQKSLVAKHVELERLIKATEALQRTPERVSPDMKSKLEATRLQLMHDIELIMRRRAELEGQIDTLMHARIEVRKQLFYGSEIQLRNQSYRVEQDRAGGIFHLADGKIALS